MLLKSKSSMKSQDVMLVQQEVENAITELAKVRGGVLFKKNHINNRTDDELNKVCQLMSLCFMTIGKWHESKYMGMCYVKEEIGIELLSPHTY